MKTAKRTRRRRTLPNLGSIRDRIAEKGFQVGLTDDSLTSIQSCGFRGNNLELAIVATDILCDEQPITLRGLTYQVVSAGWLPSTDQKHYKRLGRLMTRLRELGVVSFDWIVDGIRSTLKPSSWSGLSSYADSVRDCYRRDFWQRMPHYVHFVAEKGAIAGTLYPVTSEYDVRLSPIRGYTSLSFAHEIASQWQRIAKPIFCYYLGDFDPSGFDLQRDIREKLKRYSNKSYWFGDGMDKDDAEVAAGMTTREDQDLHYRRMLGPGSVLFRRLGVVERDFDEFNLLPLQVKSKDTRAAKFREIHGDECAEVDAIPSSELRRRVRDTIEAHITNKEEWDRLKTVEAAEKETLCTVLNSLDQNNNNGSATRTRRR